MVRSCKQDSTSRLREGGEFVLVVFLFGTSGRDFVRLSEEIIQELTFQSEEVNALEVVKE